ncbi:TPA: cupin domain-containing protein [Candidatus Woesearchaeota archaeon]|nr:cupin domain-containing protein [Candidatus Woesearchaeota archaeon]
MVEVVHMPNEKVIKIKPAFEDGRGKISNIIEDSSISHVAIITSKKGSIRANHYHPEQIQYEFLISGRYESSSKDLKKEGAKIEKIVVEPGDLVITPPMIAHAMRFTEDSVMLNITTGSRDPEKFKEHTIKYELIK